MWLIKWTFVLIFISSQSESSSLISETDDHFQFVKIGPGNFLTGRPSSSPEWVKDEVQRKVVLKEPYEIQTTEVTQSLWLKVMGQNPSHFRGASLPVEDVSWDEINKEEVGFLVKLNQLRNREGDRCAYRLPTDMEWEYAARGADKVASELLLADYFFGNQVSKLKAFAWFKENSKGKSHPVAKLKASPTGLFDIYGNVGEWTQLSSGEAYPAQRREVRGGSWKENASELRSSRHSYSDVTARGPDIGFRLVRTCP